MPSNKQQHFIPQFYLKNFSRDPSRKSINLLTLRRKKIILQASIRMQCYQDYFYGKDNDFEARLGELESYTAAVLRAVIMNDSVSNKPGVRMLLATYLAVQYQRTLAAEHDTNELFERMLRLIYRGRPDEDEMERFRIAIANTPLLNTVSAIRVSPILYDLTTVILLNRSSVDFVTSDHPVVLMNKFWKSRFAGAGANLAAAGLLIFLPLSPRHALLMYDSSVYFLERDARNALTIKKQKDIDKINELQLLRALHNVYFAHASQGEAIMRQFEEVANRRRDSYVEVDEFVEAASPGASRSGCSKSRMT